MVRNRTRTLSMISGTLLPLLAASGTFAQCPKYRVVNLGSLSTNQNQLSEAWAINDQAQIVGQSNTNDVGVAHAFFWDNAGCAGNCMKDLGALPSGTTSVAYDLNNSAEIVGESNTLIGGLLVKRATYWAPPFPVPTPPQNLGTLSTEDDADSTAYGISGASIIVGETDTDVDCVDEPGTLITLALAFKKPPGAPMEALPLPLGGFRGDPNEDSAAFAISHFTPPPEGPPPIIVGVGSPCGVSFEFCDPIEGESRDSMVWDPFVPPGIHDLAEPPGFGDGRGEARDVNDQRRIVGWGRNEAQSCKNRALFWPSAASAPDDLHVLAGLDPDDESGAEALNELGQVVGSNEGLGIPATIAYLWTPAGQNQWTVADLNDEINGSCLARWSLNVARDLNESGWIVGGGSYNGSARGFLLIRIATCLWDIAEGDGVVNVTDLLLLLGTWGPCNPPNGICPGDFDCSGDVGATDLLELLAHWDFVCSQDCGGSSAAIGGSSNTSSADVDLAIMMLGFSGVEEFGAWMDGASASEVAAMIEILAALLSP